MLLAPGMGDGIQAAKAGILEIGDIFVVNKSDRDGAQALVRELRGMIALGEREPDAWKPPIVATVAVDGQGIDELLGRIERFRASQQAHAGRLDRPPGRPGPPGGRVPRAGPAAGASSRWTRAPGWTTGRRRSAGASSTPYTAADQLLARYAWRRLPKVSTAHDPRLARAGRRGGHGGRARVR